LAAIKNQYMITFQKIQLSLATLLTFLFSELYCQEYQRTIDYSKPINCLYNDNNYLERIVFIDTTENKIINEYDVKGDNPFYKLLGIKDSLARHSIRYGFKVNDIRIDKLIDSANREIYERKIDDSILVNVAYIRENVNDSYRDLIVVGNSVSLVHDMWGVGLLNQIKIFDIRGNLVHTYSDPNLNVIYTTITDNGRYLCYVYGDDDEGGYLLHYHYRIVDLKTNNIITDVSYSKTIGIGSRYNLIIIGLSFAMKSYEKIIYDIENNKRYYRYFTWDEYKDVNMEKDGISICTNSGNYKKYYFEKDFDISLISNK
jgi:hypothetical protein